MRRLLISSFVLLGSLSCALTQGEPCGNNELCFGPMTRPETGQVLIYNNAEEPQWLDPGLATGTPDGRIIDEMFEGLIDYHPKTLKPVYGAAVSHEENADKTHFVFKIRSEARWSNGDPVTANDFVYSWERVLNPATAAQYSYILFFLKNAEGYNAERLRMAKSSLSLQTGNEAPELVAASDIVSIKESNAAYTKADVKLSPTAGGEATGLSLPKDFIVLLDKKRESLPSQKDPNVKETWLEVLAYPSLDLRKSEDAAKLGSSTASRGWLRESDLSAFFPSSNMRVLRDAATLRKQALPTAEEVLLLETREKAVIPRGEEVRIINPGAEWSRVYWPAKNRYGYLRNEQLSDPWGAVYQFRVVKQGSTTEGGWVAAKDLILAPSILGFKATDTQTLDVALENPTPFFLTLLSHYTYRPVHAATLEEWGNKWTEPEHIVCNGPFLMKEHVFRDHFTLVPNEKYWDRKTVKLEKVIAYSMNDQNTTLMMYKAGYTDLVVANDMPTSYLPLFYDYETGKPKMADFGVTSSLGTYFYRLNVKKKPFDDVRVRRALAMGFDRRKIPKATHVPFVPADSITPEGIPESGYQPPNGAQFDVAAAKKLLAEAGYPDGKGFPTISILYNTQDQHRRIAEVIQEEWRKNLNVNVVLENREWKTYLDATQNLNYQIARAGWIGDYLDPLTFLDMWVTGGGNNNTGWGKLEYDAMIDAAKKEGDPAKRRDILAKMESMLNDEMPFIPVYTYVWFDLTKPYVKGYYPNMLDKHPLKWVCIETSMTDGTPPACEGIDARIDALR